MKCVPFTSGMNVPQNFNLFHIFFEGGDSNPQFPPKNIPKTSEPATRIRKRKQFSQFT